MYLGELVADAHAQSELRVEVRLGRRHARVLAALERGLVAPAAHLHTNAVRARGCAPGGEPLPRRLPARAVFGARGAGVARVPPDPLAPGLLPRLRPR